MKVGLSVAFTCKTCDKKSTCQKKEQKETTCSLWIEYHCQICDNILSQDFLSPCCAMGLNLRKDNDSKKENHVTFL